ncbi:MAG: hypothetical protein WA783_18120 [Phormidesmis sp.]
MRNLRLFVSLLFFPAGIGLSIHLLQLQLLSDRLLAMALLLFCPELARMAWVDLENIARVKAQQEDSHLNRFYTVVVGTIVLELLGFYSALLSLQWGGLIIIFSQLEFNLLAGIQLWPQETPAVVEFGISKRWPVLIANTVGMALLGFWFISHIRIWLAGGLLLLIIIFLLLKYVVPNLRRWHLPA